MAESLKNDDKSIRSYILNDVLEKIPINKSYENLCKVIGNDVIAFYDFQYWYYRFLGGKRDLDFDRSAEPEPLQFSELPVDAVKLIVNKLEVVERLVLREVSKPLRKFVEKQESNCTYLAVSGGHDLINVSYGKGRIVYAKNEEAIDPYRHLPFIQQAAFFVYGDHYKSEAFDNLAWILKNPKLRIGHFEISNMNPAVDFFKKFEILLKSVKHQVSVRNLSLRPDHPDDILSILPYLKPGYLEEIRISDREARHDWRGAQLKVHQIMQLDQWKQAKELVLLESLHLFPEEVLEQFKKYWIKVATLSGQDLARVGNKFAASPVFEYCRFDIKETSFHHSFIDFIGVPGPLTEKYRSVRHCMIPNTDKLLVFKEFTFGDIEIEKKTRDVQ